MGIFNYESQNYDKVFYITLTTLSVAGLVFAYFISGC